MPWTQFKEVVIVSPNLASLDACACKLKGFQRRQFLWKQSSLNLRGKFHLVSSMLFNLPPLFRREAFRAQNIDEPGGLDQIEPVPIDILEGGMEGGMAAH